MKSEKDTAFLGTQENKQQVCELEHTPQIVSESFGQFQLVGSEWIGIQQKASRRRPGNIGIAAHMGGCSRGPTCQDRGDNERLKIAPEPPCGPDVAWERLKDRLVYPDVGGRGNW